METYSSTISHRVSARLERERRTIRLMIRIYCEAHHHTLEDSCPACLDLEAYAMQRIERCPYHENKPACAKCPIHCYKPDMRKQIRQVMRFAGPRMLLRHPILTLLHYWDQWTITREHPYMRG